MDSIEQHHWVAEYNWDDGFALIWPIVENQATEFATALLIYWRLGGPWQGDSPSGNTEAETLLEAVKERLLSGFYPKGRLQYYPIADWDNNLTRTQVYKLRKAGIPEELIEPQYTT